ncbi:MAG: SDR family NAD(P)-dependent oxidoreductase [Steroidobacteraceae bacterium]
MSGGAMSGGGKLRGRTAVVTGAGGGIGRGIALALAAEGANVAIAARRSATGEQTAALIRAEQGEALALTCDVSQQEQVHAAIGAIVAAYGALDIVVHNANAGDSAMPIALEAITDENWHTQAAVAWDAAFFLAQAAHAHLKNSGRGRFVMLGSCFGLHGAAMNPIYAALKGGDRGFVKALAREWGPDGITVNAIEPSAATEPTEVFFNQYPEVRAKYLSNFPMGRLGRPREDIGRAVAALCSDDFGFITAQSIQVDGGLYTAL